MWNLKVNTLLVLFVLQITCQLYSELYVSSKLAMCTSIIHDCDISNQYCFSLPFGHRSSGYWLYRSMCVSTWLRVMTEAHEKGPCLVGIEGRERIAVVSGNNHSTFQALLFYFSGASNGHFDAPFETSCEVCERKIGGCEKRLRMA